MTKQKIGRVLRRTRKQEFGKRKNPLPENLSLLADIPFYAVTECQLPDSTERQTRVEILPRNLKMMVKKQEEENKRQKTIIIRYKKKIKKLSKTVKKLEKKNNELSVKDKDSLSEIRGLKEANQIQKANLEQLNTGNDHVIEVSMKSPLQRAEEKGIKLHGPPLSGGLPGLGKKR